jgi:osmotically-inducible protein OsmY
MSEWNRGRQDPYRGSQDWRRDQDRGGRFGEGSREARSFEEDEGRYGGGQRSGGQSYGPSGRSYREEGYGAYSGPDYGAQSFGGETGYRRGGYGSHGGEDYGGGWQGSGRDSQAARDYASGSRFYGGSNQQRSRQPYGRQDYGQSSSAFAGRNEFVQHVADGDKDLGGIGRTYGRDEGEHRGRGPKNYKRSDERIREDVSDRLSDDSWLDASEIDVKVSDCEVTLTGTVDSREDKRRAEDLAEAVSGVRHVQNNLRVQAPTGQQRSGAQATTGTGGTTVTGTTGAPVTGASRTTQ